MGFLMEFDRRSIEDSSGPGKKGNDSIPGKSWLVSAASSQLGSRPVNGWGGGEGGGGPVAGKEPDTPAPPGMSGHQPQRRVTGGSPLK